MEPKIKSIILNPQLYTLQSTPCTQHTPHSIPRTLYSSDLFLSGVGTRAAIRHRLMTWHPASGRVMRWRPASGRAMRWHPGSGRVLRWHPASAGPVGACENIGKSKVVERSRARPSELAVASDYTKNTCSFNLRILRVHIDISKTENSQSCQITRPCAPCLLFYILRHQWGTWTNTESIFAIAFEMVGRKPPLSAPLVVGVGHLRPARQVIDRD
mmetsp:Transcript_10245/g.16382  ORF Transcript_10245/g.16382 Transcript_10245/m.16382 type:complete len:214 (+) Transcript_10245:573-1214(+)